MDALIELLQILYEDFVKIVESPEIIQIVDLMSLQAKELIIILRDLINALR